MSGQTRGFDGPVGVPTGRYAAAAGVLTELLGCDVEAVELSRGWLLLCWARGDRRGDVPVAIVAKTTPDGSGIPEPAWGCLAPGKVQTRVFEALNRGGV